MSEISAAAPAAGIASWRDFVTLMKPRVMSLVVFTALAGLLAAPGGLHPVLGAAAILCIALGAGAAGALNMGLEAARDAAMSRTRSRPTAAGRISPEDAIVFGGAVSVFSVVGLALATTYAAAAWLAVTIFLYAVVYTLWLKPRTDQNIVIGGASGALPPVVAWAAATGAAPLEAWVLFAIIFLWTPPHFWALALLSKDDYARAGLPMMPNVRGDAATRRQIWLYSLATAVSGFVPVAIGLGGWLYLASAALATTLFLAAAWRARVDGPARQARTLFAASILYLFILFGAVIAEHGLGLYAAVT